MAAPDKKTVMKDLLEMGKAKGQLTTKEILDALGELDFEPEQIEKFYDTLESQGVEIVEDLVTSLWMTSNLHKKKTEKMKIWSLLSAQKASQLMTL